MNLFCRVWLHSWTTDFQSNQDKDWIWMEEIKICKRCPKRINKGIVLGTVVAKSADRISKYFERILNQ